MYTRTYTCYNKLRQNYPGAHNYTEQPVTEDPDLANDTPSDTTQMDSKNQTFHTDIDIFGVQI